MDSALSAFSTFMGPRRVHGEEDGAARVVGFSIPIDEPNTSGPMRIVAATLMTEKYEG
jgi:hypothetical protein